MTDESRDLVEFDDLVSLALAHAAAIDPAEAPGPDVRERLLARIHGDVPPPAGFSFRLATDQDWRPHPVPGIRMKVLSACPTRGYVTLLLDVAPGTRFPAHHHGGDEECYVLSGSVFTCGRRLGPGDFVHADAGTDHGELWTDEGCTVLLVVPPDDHAP
jgi:quercetin dioxygenase-like cupin family protein